MPPVAEGTVSPSEVAREAFYLLYLFGMAVVLAAEFYTITQVWRKRL